MSTILIQIGSLNIAAGATTAGSNLRSYSSNSSGVPNFTGAFQSGTWRNDAGVSVGLSAGTSNTITPFTRTA
jgi:hypothetical protein